MSKTLLIVHHTPSPATRELLVIETPRLTDRIPNLDFCANGRRRACSRSLISSAISAV
jgi:hypothetical protein